MDVERTLPRADVRQRAPARLVRLAVHLLGLLPLAELFVRWQAGALTVNPIQYVEQFLGRAAAHLLIASLAVTPLVTLTGFRRLTRHRRALGLYAFFYFTLHLGTFAVIDFGLQWDEILLLTAEKPYMFVGAAAGLILLALAVTSFKYWERRLGKTWKALHRGAYIAGGLVVLHYAWAVKGSLTTLTGDILRPLVLGLVLLVLLVLRIPPVRRWAAGLRR